MLKIRHLKAGIAQLVEHDLAKVGVASSSLVSRSKLESRHGAKPSPAFWNSSRGQVAEWLCCGLQSRLRRFDSDPGLQLAPLWGFFVP